MSSLILLPPIIAITLLFAKAGPAPPKKKKSFGRNANASDRRATSNDGNNINSNNNNGNVNTRRRRWVWGRKPSKKPQKKRRYWPYWCRYIAWSLTALAIAASAFFTILYSFEFGGEKSRAWLIAFLLSFFQSVLLMQPVKVGLKYTPTPYSCF